MAPAAFFPYGLIKHAYRSTGELGELVRRQRRSLKLTQVDAAGLCGVGERFLRELEHGKPTVELGRTLRVLAGLGIELDARGRGQ